jgi:hypothetical protein
VQHQLTKQEKLRLWWEMQHRQLERSVVGSRCPP